MMFQMIKQDPKKIRKLAATKKPTKKSKSKKRDDVAKANHERVKPIHEYASFKPRMIEAYKELQRRLLNGEDSTKISGEISRRLGLSHGAFIKSFRYYNSNVVIHKPTGYEEIEIPVELISKTNKRIIETQTADFIACHESLKAGTMKKDAYAALGKKLGIKIAGAGFRYIFWLAREIKAGRFER